MAKTSIIKRLNKMLEYTNELIDKIKDKSFQDLASDQNLLESSCFVIGLIGEEVPGFIITKEGKNIKDDDYDDFFKECKDVNWREIKDMRNIVFHDYEGVNIDIIWQTLQEMPIFKSQLVELINKLS